jgi:hypothetical protein
MADVVDRVAELAVESGFSGVIRVDRSGREPWSADRLPEVGRSRETGPGRFGT